MPLVASLASLVAAMRARVLDRGACGPLADRRVAAAARRELALAICLLLGTNVADCVGVEHDHQGCCYINVFSISSPFVQCSEYIAIFSFLHNIRRYMYNMSAI